ncbi:hypothetical protein [Metabacillus idriensis]|uniref:hypothetical protein n=1 Tax=Metabacillus idriensis TaxID=324768 RepID=UPI003D278739
MHQTEFYSTIIIGKAEGSAPIRVLQHNHHRKCGRKCTKPGFAAQSLPEKLKEVRQTGFCSKIITGNAEGSALNPVLQHNHYRKCRRKCTKPCFATQSLPEKLKEVRQTGFCSTIITESAEGSAPNRV